MAVVKDHVDLGKLLDNNTLEQITNFVYLGSQIAEDAKCTQGHKKTFRADFSDGWQAEQDLEVSQHLSGR
jgi:hypothetical protein